MNYPKIIMKKNIVLLNQNYISPPTGEKANGPQKKPAQAVENKPDR